MAAINRWTREQLLVAFTLYSQIPFGKLHALNPDIIHYAGLIGRTPSALAMKLVNIASLDPFIIESGRRGLTGASKADRELWQEMDRDSDAFEQQCQSAMTTLEKPLTALQETPAADFSGREKTTIIKARVGQQLFRKRVLDAYENRCCLTGLEEPMLLVASHIRPWNNAVEHRLDPSNGLCLSSLHDKAFDRGLITFNDHLELVLSPRIKQLKSAASEQSFAKYEGHALRLPIAFPPDVSQLAYHRQHIFIATH
ncbi:MULTISPECIES: HNH endonuclease [unclassified Symbiopectobacterium]|uniref:HNH endonuclease n=2 Tax=Symbiopectobacterium TaxID=801 RepID=UPI0022270AAE|nr:MULTISPECIES: HNH endonuclease signature motif containing protein [unclassified Symbiopectobacterium]MCW2473975.1 HNH endonuclease [Candidatus Symbiopectobacterium sp. NZEC151]MCW2485218.1 HNH endonuclease [Candidatus Symbiopectobacterium sp. NZEC127]